MTTKHWAVHLDTSESATATALTEFTATWEAQATHYNAVTIPAGRVSGVAVDIPSGSTVTVNGLQRSGPDIFSIESGHPESLLGQSVNVTVTSGTATVVASAASEHFKGSLS